MADEHMKKMLNIISHWEMQTKTTVKYHYVPKITLTGPSVGKEGEKLGLLYALLEMLKNSTTLGFMQGICFIFKETAKLFPPSIRLRHPPSCLFPKETAARAHTKTCT